MSDPCPQPAACHQKTPRRQAWIWSAAKEKAAKLLAIDDLTDERIAQECGTYKRNLERWKHFAEFKARVNEHREHYRSEVLDSKYCRKEQRILLRQQLIEKCIQIIEQRAAWPGMDKIPGGTTGLVRPVVRSIGGKIVTEYETDATTEQIIRNNLKEIAREVGDWKSINDFSGAPVTQTNVVFQISETRMRVAGDRIEGPGVVLEGQDGVVEAAPDRPEPSGQ